MGSINPAELEKWRKRYRSLLDAINTGFLLFDKDYNCYLANNTFLSMVGLKREDVEGQNMRAFLSTTEFEALFSIVEPKEEDLKKRKFPAETKFYQF